MEERELEALLRRVLPQDFSAGTDRFREALLARCLAELDAGDVAELDDADLALLAAAGDAASVAAGRFKADNALDC